MFSLDHSQIYLVSVLLGILLGWLIKCLTIDFKKVYDCDKELGRYQIDKLAHRLEEQDEIIFQLEQVADILIRDRDMKIKDILRSSYRDDQDLWPLDLDDNDER